MPSAQSVANSSGSGSPVKSGTSLSIPGAPQQEYIPFEVGDRKVPLKVIPTIDFSIPRTINHAKNLLKGGGVAGLIGSAVFVTLLDSIDAVIEDGGTVSKPGKLPSTTPDVFWCVPTRPQDCRDSNYYDKRRLTPKGFAAEFAAAVGPTWSSCSEELIPINATTTDVKLSTSNNGCATSSFQTFRLYRHGTCKSGYNYDSSLLQCVAPSGPVPLEAADFDALGVFANAQNADWLKGLLRDSCSGSPSPNACFESLKDSSVLSGPATVQGPVTTSTTTTVSPTGVASQLVTTSNTTYNIKYGPTYFDYSKTITHEAERDGVKESETVEEETEEVTEEEPVEEPKEEESSPCEGSHCDGPAYEDLYSPTEETKEDHLDSYSDRISSIPIISAAGSLFDVSISAGSCPTWSYNGTLDLGMSTMPIDLVFDYLCLPWFVDFKPWIQAIVLLGFTVAAIRIGIL